LKEAAVELAALHNAGRLSTNVHSHFSKIVVPVSSKVMLATVAVGHARAATYLKAPNPHGLRLA